MVSQMVHLGAISAMTWMPLGLWGIDEAVERRDWRPLWKTALASALGFPRRISRIVDGVWRDQPLFTR